MLLDKEMNFLKKCFFIELNCKINTAFFSIAETIFFLFFVFCFFIFLKSCSG